jgi:hypothetical protein
MGCRTEQICLDIAEMSGAEEAKALRSDENCNRLHRGLLQMATHARRLTIECLGESELVWVRR